MSSERHAVLPGVGLHRIAPGLAQERRAGRLKDQKFLISLATPTGFEPVTPRLGIWCSIHLSYGAVSRNSLAHLFTSLERRFSGGGGASISSMALCGIESRRRVGGKPAESWACEGGPTCAPKLQGPRWDSLGC